MCPIFLEDTNPQYLGAELFSNNSAELGAAIVVLAALLALPSLPLDEIIVRPDSDYVIGLAEGTLQPKHNRTKA